MVKAWREIVTIPTYEVGKPEKNPIFLENRVYQGSSGVVYPYPVIESISDEKVDKEWKAIYLENEYTKVMVLPELGGRIREHDRVSDDSSPELSERAQLRRRRGSGGLGLRHLLRAVEPQRRRERGDGRRKRPLHLRHDRLWRRLRKRRRYRQIPLRRMGSARVRARRRVDSISLVS